jgi:hypothetical protein
MVQDADGKGDSRLYRIGGGLCNQTQALIVAAAIHAEIVDRAHGLAPQDELEEDRRMQTARIAELEKQSVRMATLLGQLERTGMIATAGR